jgi:hypothetical protein
MKRFHHCFLSDSQNSAFRHCGPWSNTSQAHGGLMRRSVWLKMWAAGMTPKDAKRTQSLLRAPHNSKNLDLQIADNDLFS